MLNAPSENLWFWRGLAAFGGHGLFPEKKDERPCESTENDVTYIGPKGKAIADTAQEAEKACQKGPVGRQKEHAAIFQGISGKNNIKNTSIAINSGWPRLINKPPELSHIIKSIP